MKTLITLFFCLSALVAYSQAKKPTLMVVPSDALMKELGALDEIGGQYVPNYSKAFVECPNLNLVISKINGQLGTRGFPLKNLESVLKTLATRSAEETLLMSSSSGESLTESATDMLRKTAKADIIIQLSYNVNKSGPLSSVTYNLQGIDAFTDKQIASAAGTGAKSMSAEVPLLLEEAVLANMDKFTSSLQSHFDELFEKGREIVIYVKKWDDWEFDFETGFGDDDEELGYIIEDWLADNTKEGRFNTTDATESLLTFEQVRIPLYYERNGRQRAIDARWFVRQLSKYLKNEPFYIESKVYTRGLGEVWLIIGSK